MGKLPDYVKAYLFPLTVPKAPRLMLMTDIGGGPCKRKHLTDQEYLFRERILDKAQSALNNAKRAKKKRREKYWVHVGLKWALKRKNYNER